MDIHCFRPDINDDNIRSAERTHSPAQRGEASHDDLITVLEVDQQGSNLKILRASESEQCCVLAKLLARLLVAALRGIAIAREL